MRIAVVGPGAIGCLFAGLLSQAKHEVWLLDHDPKRARVLAKRGISISGISGESVARVRATVEAESIGQAELVLVTVKSYDTNTAAAAARPLVGAETAVLSLQNGLGHIEILQEQLGEDRVLGGSTSQAATLLGPGQVHHTGQGRTEIGEPSGGVSERLTRISEVFTAALLPTDITTKLESVLWSKLTVNTGINPVAALARVRNGGILESASLRQVLRAAVEETSAVAEAKGIHLLQPDMVQYAEEICQRTANNVNSMLQDILRGRQTEIDAINGAVVREGELAGVATPANYLLVHLVRGIEQTYAARISR